MLFKRHDGSDFITVVVLKNREPELSYILAELFNKCLKGSSYVFQIEGFIVGPCMYLRMLGKGLQLKATVLLLVFFLVVSEVFEKLVKIEFLITERNKVFFSDFQYGFRSS